MAYSVLGQAAPAATTATDLYTVPTGKSTVVSTLAICNRGATQTTYRVAIRKGGAALANQHYIAYDAPLPANSSDFLTIGPTLAAGDVVTIYAGNANLSASVFGNEA